MKSVLSMRKLGPEMPDEAHPAPSLQLLWIQSFLSPGSGFELRKLCLVPTMINVTLGEPSSRAAKSMSFLFEMFIINMFLSCLLKEHLLQLRVLKVIVFPL